MRVREDLFASAIAAIEEQEIAKNGKVPNEFKGYIDTFAASIVQNGLIPAVIFFESKDSDNKEESKDIKKEKTQKNRNKMMQVILSLVNKQKVSAESGKNATLYKCIKPNEKNGKDIKKIRRDIVEAAVAFKLALRTFEFEK